MASSLSDFRFLGPKIWAMVPQNIKNYEFLQEFERLIKVWKPKPHPCRMWEQNISKIGFI